MGLEHKDGDGASALCVIMARKAAVKAREIVVEEDSEEEEDEQDFNDSAEDSTDDDADTVPMQEEGDNEDDEDDEDDGEDDDESETGHEDVVDDLKYDLYNLTAFDYHSLRLSENADRREAALKEKTLRATQLLVRRIFGLPVEDDAAGPLATLPNDDVTRLPRAQRVPDAAPMTKWEKFAVEKGIKKVKRERMVFDEQAQEYKPRYGYKSIKGGIEDQPIVEIKKGQDPFADPWEAARVDKKSRVDKNLKNQVKNQDRAAGRKGRDRAGLDGALKTYGACASAFVFFPLFVCDTDHATFFGLVCSHFSCPTIITPHNNTHPHPSQITT